MSTDKNIDPGLFREALGHHPTGVAVVSSLNEDGQPVGFIVGTFNSVSMDPPLVGFLPMKDSYSFAAIEKAGFFTVNILAHDQEAVCRALMRRQPNKFEGLEWRPSTNGSPIIDGVVLSIDCSMDNVAPAGDHYFATGLVQNLVIHRPVAPLLFFQGGFGGFVPGSFVAPSDAIVAEAVQQVQGIREDMERLADDTQGEVTAYAKVGDHAVAVALAKAPNLTNTTMIGSKFPLTPPFGEVFLANAPQAEHDAWFAGAERMGEQIVTIAEKRLDFFQKHGWVGSHAGEQRDSQLFPALVGYGVEGITPADQREMRTILTAAANELLPPDPSSRERHSAASLVAPIYGEDGRVSLMLRLSNLPEMDVADVFACGEKLAATAAKAGRSVEESS